MRAQTCSASSQGLNGLGMGRSTSATSATRMDNPALPKHHVDSWSLTCGKNQLSAYCLAFTFPTSLCDFLAFKTEFNWDCVALRNRLSEMIEFFDCSLLCVPNPVRMLQVDDACSHRGKFSQLTVWEIRSLCI